MFGPHYHSIYIGAAHVGEEERRDFMNGPRNQQLGTEPTKAQYLEALDHAVRTAQAAGRALRITNVVNAGGTSAGICFGDLEARGLMTKEYLPEWLPDNYTIRWEVVGDVIFSDAAGNLYTKGDVVLWPK